MRLFGLESYHVLLVAIGASIILAYWFPRFLSRREPATSALLMNGAQAGETISVPSGWDWIKASAGLPGSSQPKQSGGVSTTTWRSW